MNTQTWIELVALILTTTGGGGAALAKLTRIAVSLELMTKQMEQVTAAAADTQVKLQDHELRLAKGGL